MQVSRRTMCLTLCASLIGISVLVKYFRQDADAAIPVTSPWSDQTYAGRLAGQQLSRSQVAHIVEDFCSAVGRPIPKVAPATLDYNQKKGDDWFDDRPYRGPFWSWRNQGLVVEVADGTGIVVKYEDKKYIGHAVSRGRPLTSEAMEKDAIAIVQKSGVWSYISPKPYHGKDWESSVDGFYFYFYAQGTTRDETFSNGVRLTFVPSGHLASLKLDCRKSNEPVNS